MTVPPPPALPRTHGPAVAGTIAGVSFFVAPVALVIGLFGSLAWVYLSIAALLVAIGSLVVAPPSPDWLPPLGWVPDPAWPAAPNDWSWWVRRA